MTPEQIAAGLSTSAVAALRCAEQDGHLGNWFVRWWHTDSRTMKAMRKAGLGFTVWSGMALTPLGQQVAAILKDRP